MRSAGLTALALSGAVIFPATVVSAETAPPDPRPGFNLFSVQQDIDLGRQASAQAERELPVMRDASLERYLNEVAQRLVAVSPGARYPYRVRAVDATDINAFTFPGGFIYVDRGLLAATRNESELAGVLAHEVSHVTQRHMARAAQSQGQTALATTAGVIAAILLGAATGMGDDAVQAALAVSQGINAQHQIDFTRANEAEADRIGLNVAYEAGYDPFGMPTFFEKLAHSTGESQVPEFLLTHPVTTDRIAETRDRAAKLGHVDVQESESYVLMRARLRALVASTPEDAIADFTRLADGNITDGDEALRYGYSVALLRAGRAADAVQLMRGLLAARPTLVAYHVGLGQALLASGASQEAIKTFARANELFPRNIPLTMRYAQALIDTGEPGKAHTMLLDLLNNIDYTPEQVHLIALAANAAGETAEAHYYMAEMHVMNGDLPLAISQLEIALATPGIEPVQRARFEARISELRQYLPDKHKHRGENEQSGRPG